MNILGWLPLAKNTLVIPVFELASGEYETNSLGQISKISTATMTELANSVSEKTSFVSIGDINGGTRVKSNAFPYSNIEGTEFYWGTIVGWLHSNKAYKSILDMKKVAFRDYVVNDDGEIVAAITDIYNFKPSQDSSLTLVVLASGYSLGSSTSNAILYPISVSSPLFAPDPATFNLGIVRYNNLTYFISFTNGGTVYSNLTSQISVYPMDFDSAIAAAGTYDFDPYSPGGTSGPSGGGGSFGEGEVSDSIIGDIPTGSVAGDASATGTFTRYLANSSYLDTFGDWLWATDLGTAIAQTIINKIYGDPAQSVISIMSYPFDIKSLSGVKTKNQNLFWGNYDSGKPFIALTSQSASIDWGTITLSEFWGNFLDYSPHTKIELYLPWCTGFVPIDPNDCLPGSLQVITNIELSKGTCIHNVIGNNGVVIGQYSGQCGKQIPVFSSDFASKMVTTVTAAVAGISAVGLGVAGTIGGGMAASSGMVFGNVSATSVGGHVYTHAADAFMAGAREQLQNPMNAGLIRAGSNLASRAMSNPPPSVNRNGGFTDGSAELGVQYPYIILSRPTQNVPAEYGHHYGYPSNMYYLLSDPDIKGYTEIGEIHLNGIPATDAEISELDHILKRGVIL